MDISPMASKLEGQMLIACALVLLSIHCRAETGRLRQWLHSVTSVDFEQKKAKANVDAQVDELLKEVRHTNMLLAWDLIMTIYVPLTIAAIAFCFSQASASISQDMFWVFGIHSICYAVMLSVKYGGVRIRPRLMQHVCYTLFFTRLCSMSNAAMFFGMGHVRLITRLIIGVGCLDHVTAALWEIAFATAAVIRHAYFSRDISEVQLPLSFVILHELAAGILLWSVVYAVQMWIRERLIAQLEARSSASEASAVRRLLSVLCDAEVQLGPDLRITAYHERLGRLLMISNPSSLRGVELAHYMASADRERFLSFIESAAGTTYGEVEGSESFGTCAGEGRDQTCITKDHCRTLPPASLQVHLRDSAGVSFSVELYYVYLHDLGSQPAHLIGICEGDGRTSAQATSPEILQKTPGYFFSCMRSPIMSESSSRSSQSSRKLDSEALNCLKCVDLSFDPTDSNPTIDTCTFCFHAEDDNPQQLKTVPRLLTYFRGDCRSTFSDWLMGKVNIACHEGAPHIAQTIQDMRILIPGGGRSSMCVTADVTLTLEDGGLGESSECEEISSVSSAGLTASVTIHNFSAARALAGGKKHMHLPRITEAS